jgi:hypothetical protein
VSNESPGDQASSEGETPIGGVVSTAVDVLGGAITGIAIPAPFRKNAFRAFGQLCTALVDIPVAHLEGIATEKRAETQARVKLISTGADQIAAQMNVAPDYAAAAVRKFGERIVREQVNLDAVSQVAARELSNPATPSSDQHEGEKEPAPIDSDWLNSFEKEASQKSAEEMQQLFGRILAEEIRKPSTFSLKTIRLLGQLDAPTARLFSKLCSLSVSMRISGQVWDARVIAKSDPASNSLQDFGLGFAKLNALHEYGLIIPDYNSFLDYKLSIAVDNKVRAPFTFQGVEWGLVPTANYTEGGSTRANGVALTRSGAELLTIVEPEPDDKYTQALHEFWSARNLRMERIGT